MSKKQPSKPSSNEFGIRALVIPTGRTEAGVARRPNVIVKRRKSK